MRNVITKLLGIITFIGLLIYLLSLSGPYLYYGSLRTLISKIPTLLISILGSILIGYGATKLFAEKFHIYLSILSVVILLFFVIKLIVNLWMASILSDSIFTIIGWILVNSKIVFSYTILYDIVWCVGGVCYAISSINDEIVLSKKVHINWM